MQDRRNPRTEALLAAELFAGGRVRAVLIVDASIGGALIEPPEDLVLVPGELVLVRLYGLQATTAARVRWVRDGQVGIEFRHPLHPTTLDFALNDYAKTLDPSAEAADRSACSANRAA
ncbi:PilZ domain-containing protein [Parerythrobacter lacustris]|uniref:PilZ domain-containing protein n=1 Tax=Parerythrobacter lacustris TaxID=2969984 RepID=A0ABT1XS60_9SPHN|nr:PilZ domain-containing protein [Parerythrobacter lacustris]MCR2833282.1 PilZ domain-containing protein [Parerythrobacter lacustris]